MITFDDTTSDEVWTVLNRTNTQREAQGLPALTLSEGLMEIVAIRTTQITALGESGLLNDYEHKQPDGTSYSVLLDGKYQNFAENYTAGPSAPTPAKAVNEWMNSQKHRDNILNPNFRKLGIGYNESDSDPSNIRYYLEQLFADGLTTTEKVSTADLLTASIKVNTVSKSILGTNDADSLENTNYGVTIAALGGNDTITNSGINVSISGGTGSETIFNNGANVTINSGVGDDAIALLNNAKNNLIVYRAGDGNDYIEGFNSTTTLSISGDEYTPFTVGSNIVVEVGT